MDTQGFIREVYEAIFGSEIERIKTTLNELITQNGLRGNPSYGFLYGGAFHTNMDLKTLAKFPKKILHPDLRAQGQDYVRDKAILDRGLGEVKHALTALLKPCKDEQDIRDLLTNTVVFFLPSLQGIPRTRDPGWAFAGSAIEMHNFQHTVGVLEAHLANRLI